MQCNVWNNTLDIYARWHIHSCEKHVIIGFSNGLAQDRRQSVSWRNFNEIKSKFRNSKFGSLEQSITVLVDRQIYNKILGIVDI